MAGHRLVHCGEHGEQRATYVCQHVASGLRDGGQAPGFWSAEEPGNARPDAWCDVCKDQLARAEGEWNETLEALARVTVLCAGCYDTARKQNGVWPFVSDPNETLRRCAELAGATPRKSNFWQDWTYLTPQRPKWARGDALEHYFRNFGAAFRGGRITWGCTVQANTALFEPGKWNSGGEVVYVRDPKATVDLVALRSVADDLFALKGTRQPDAVFGEISRYLADELTRVFGLRVPELISPELPCAVTSVFLDRRHFPNGVLSKGAYPVLVLDCDPPVVALLPSRFWPEELKRHWCRP